MLIFGFRNPPPMKRKLVSVLLACTVCLGLQAQILPSANPQADSVEFAKIRSRMDSIRQYRPTVALVLAGGGAEAWPTLEL